MLSVSLFLCCVVLAHAFFLFGDEEPVIFCIKVCPLYCKPRRKRDVDASSLVYIDDTPYIPYHEKHQVIQDHKFNDHHEVTPYHDHHEPAPYHDHHEVTPYHDHHEAAPYHDRHEVTPYHDHHEAAPYHDHHDPAPYHADHHEGVTYHGHHEVEVVPYHFDPYYFCKPPKQQTTTPAPTTTTPTTTTQEPTGICMICMNKCTKYPIPKKS